MFGEIPTRWLAIQIVALKVWISEFGKRMFIDPLIGCFPLHKKYRLCIYIYNEINLFNPHYIPLYPHAIRIIQQIPLAPCLAPRTSAEPTPGPSGPGEQTKIGRLKTTSTSCGQNGKPHVWRLNCVFMRMFWGLTKFFWRSNHQTGEFFLPKPWDLSTMLLTGVEPANIGMYSDIINTENPWNSSTWRTASGGSFHQVRFALTFGWMIQWMISYDIIWFTYIYMIYICDIFIWCIYILRDVCSINNMSHRYWSSYLHTNNWDVHE